MKRPARAYLRQYSKDSWNGYDTLGELRTSFWWKELNISEEEGGKAKNDVKWKDEIGSK